MQAEELKTEPEVRTIYGPIRGREEGTLSVFKGIPFAAPPVGEARFAAPRPPSPWEAIREAFSFGPPPPQDVGLAVRPSDSQNKATGDDWLTVNVWTPNPEKTTLRPVMVWIYGGAYKLGSSADPGYDAYQIASEGNVVVVTFNYRMGVEGFARIEGAPANRGLLDQVAALEWVRDNILAFGGDPGQVTVFGESAGAGGVVALLAMPRTAGLFKRAIIQSMPGIYFSNDLAGDIAIAIAAELGLRPTIADLSEVGPDTLVSAGASVSAKLHDYENRWGTIASGVYPLIFAPVIDGEVLPVTPWQALEAGAGRDVELIVGHTSDEFRLFMAFGGQLGKITDEQATSALQVFGPTSDSEQRYREGFPKASSERLYEIVQSDWLFRMPSLKLVEAQVAAGGTAYMYELTWQTPGTGGVLGAPHGLDGPLVFGTFKARLGPTLLGPEPSAGAVELSARFRSAWIAFAATGNPGWPRYDTQQRLVEVFDLPIKVTVYPEDVSVHIWQNHAFLPLPLLGT